MVPPNTNEATRQPHIYKKGSILKFKKLNEGIDRTNRVYTFSSNSSTISAVNNQCNNINQVLGRNYLGTAKLLSYFGLSKDPSEELSKEPSIFKKFFKDFKDSPSSSKEGGDISKVLKNLQDLIEKQDSKVKNLEEKLDQLLKRTPEQVVKEVKEDLTNKFKDILRKDDLENKLKEIKDLLKQIIG